MRLNWIDRLVAVVLVTGYVALLFSTVSDLGYARDEGFYFGAAGSYERWFELLLRDPRQALLPSTVDRFWTANHEHPALMKSLFALSHHYLYGKWHFITEPGTALRFPGMVVSALALGTLFVWGRQTLGRTSGLVAALSYAAMPRVFYHSHLCAFDAPVASLWLLTAYSYWRAWQRSGWWWPLLTGVLYGLLLNTKHNSWLLPGALGLHWLITRGPLGWHALRHKLGLGEAKGSSRGSVRRGRRSGVPRALVTMVTLGPLVFFALWPWIWHDTWLRLQGYATFHLRHDYYNMEFLGRTYWKPPMPRLYAWVMTLGTVPAITLILFGIGGVTAFGGNLAQRGRALRAWTTRLLGRTRFSAAEERSTVRQRQRHETYVLWALGVLVSYAPWFSTNTPIFGGTKHWLTSYPFLCLFAALGFATVLRHVVAAVAELAPRLLALSGQAIVTGILLASVLVGPIVMTADSHPFALSNYTPLVGGAPGAATLGLNRTFWGYTTGSLQEFLSTRAPHNAEVYVHDTALQSFNMMREERRVRPDLRGTLELHTSDVALYHHEPHMGRVEYQIWVDYGTTQPTVLKTHQGVPVVWLYERPIPSATSPAFGGSMP